MLGGGGGVSGMGALLGEAGVRVADELCKLEFSPATGRLVVIDIWILRGSEYHPTSHYRENEGWILSVFIHADV